MIGRAMPVSFYQDDDFNAYDWIRFARRRQKMVIRVH